MCNLRDNGCMREKTHTVLDLIATVRQSIFEDFVEYEAFIRQNQIYVQHTFMFAIIFNAKKNEQMETGNSYS